MTGSSVEAAKRRRSCSTSSMASPSREEPLRSDLSTSEADIGSSEFVTLGAGDLLESKGLYTKSIKQESNATIIK
jgi:hypothetical protein